MLKAVLTKIQLVSMLCYYIVVSKNSIFAIMQKSHLTDTDIISVNSMSKVNIQFTTLTKMVKQKRTSQIRHYINKTLKVQLGFLVSNTVVYDTYLRAV
jgi:hypothetical protein